MIYENIFVVFFMFYIKLIYKTICLGNQREYITLYTDTNSLFTLYTTISVMKEWMKYFLAEMR